MKLYTYKVNWSPYFTGLRARSKADAERAIRAQYPHARGNFFIFGA